MAVIVGKEPPPASQDPATPAPGDPEGGEVAVPERLALTHSAAVCTFFYRPALLNIFGKDVHLPVEALKDLGGAREPAAVVSALASILGYLDENPYFFTYRFGREGGEAMGAGLRELHALTAWAAASWASAPSTSVQAARWKMTSGPTLWMPLMVLSISVTSCPARSQPYTSSPFSRSHSTGGGRIARL